MRGIVSAAMTAHLDRAGFTGCFDLVVGSSAGALNGAALLAGVIDGCVESYATMLRARAFINPWRLLIGRRLLDVGWAVDQESDALDPDRHRRTVESAIELHCVAVDVRDARAVDFTGMATTAELRAALLASSCLPWVGGPPVVIGGRGYLDGGLAEPIPVGIAAAAGATHALVLQTRSAGEARKRPFAPFDAMVRRFLRRENPALVGLYTSLNARQARTVSWLARETTAPSDSAPPWVAAVRPASGAPVDRFERDPDVLRRAAAAAREEMARVVACAAEVH
jgi:predicted patatin/cPLA2 family phospholipase